MSLPKIIKAPATVLSTATKPVENIDGALVKLTKTMGLVTRAAHGVGLAANQIGYSKSMFVYLDGGKLHTVINPQIQELSMKEVSDAEGCLSIPGKTFMIARPNWIVITYTTLDGCDATLRAEDHLARCFLHEIEHLKGQLINEPSGVYRLV